MAELGLLQETVNMFFSFEGPKFFFLEKMC